MRMLHQLVAAALVLAGVGAAHAGRPVDPVATASLSTSVTTAGAFTREFVLYTDLAYNPSTAAIYVSGLGTNFSRLTLDVQELSGADLLPGVALGLLDQTGVRKATFADRAYPFSLTAGNAYKVLVEGVALQGGASFGLNATYARSVSVVPEPSSAAMFLVGLGLLAGVARRRTQR